MNRSHYFNIIEEKLHVLATRIEGRGKLNILDLHLHSEDFYKSFLNLIFGWGLQNLNHTKQNIEGIDLVDDIKRIAAQVSATATKAKVESALIKDLKAFAGYAFKFISISKDASDLRTKTFQNPHSLTFDPQKDIYDIQRILHEILVLDVIHQKTIAEFIRRELGSEVDQMRVESSLAAIISILAKEDWNSGDSVLQTQVFEIDQKITYNQLNAARSIVEDYKIHHARIDKIYSEFNKMGANKSISVLHSIRLEYLSYKTKLAADELFLKIAERVIERIQTSSNYVPIPVEELELCVNILVVDAFIRCKIFENPMGAVHAAP